MQLAYEAQQCRQQNVAMLAALLELSVFPSGDKFTDQPPGYPPPLGVGGMEAHCPALCLPISIIVSIGTLHQRAVAPTDVIYLPDSKTASRSHGHTSNMRARMFACGHNGLDQIVSLEPMHSLVGFRTGAREAVLIHRAHLSPPAPNGLNTPGLQLFRRLRWIVAHTSRIQPVVFRVAQPNAVLLGAPATPERDRQSQFLERVPNRVSGGVHRRRIRKRLSGLRQYPFQSCWIMCQELSHIPTPLSLVAGMARNEQVADAIASTPRLRVDVLYLKRYILRATVGTLAAPLLQQVLAHLVACQFALLVLNPADDWVLHELGVEADRLYRNPAEWYNHGQTVCPMAHILHARHERWR